jgi:hypothetical protein
MNGLATEELTVTVRLPQELVATLTDVSRRRGKSLDETITNLVVVGYDAFLDFAEQIRKTRGPIPNIVP